MMVRRSERVKTRVNKQIYKLGKVGGREEARNLERLKATKTTYMKKPGWIKYTYK